MLFIDGCASGPTLYERARAAMEHGEYAEAAKLYAEIEEEDLTYTPNDTCYIGIATSDVKPQAVAFAMLNKVSDAENMVTKAENYLLTKPLCKIEKMDERYENLFYIYEEVANAFEKNNNNKSVDYAEKILKLTAVEAVANHRQWSALRSAGEIFDRIGRQKEAFSAFDKACQFDCSSKKFFNELIVLATALGFNQYVERMSQELKFFEQVEDGKRIMTRTDAAGERAYAQLLLKFADEYEKLGSTFLASQRRRDAAAYFGFAQTSERYKAAQAKWAEDEAREKKARAAKEQLETQQMWSSIATAVGVASANIGRGNNQIGSSAQSAQSGYESGISLQTRSSTESCVCGPDYIPCYERGHKRHGTKYTITRRSDGRLAITSYGHDGLVTNVHSWGGGSDCSAIAK